ncbi:DUF2147 domain-containing protein [Niabella pedocola]|uniref:DUF2147 domain-containing protein n=1 Tax=Niabella pedocola TaxID=1752077 RepID=A0ABS8PJR4_9BACT|nr:DUF2147 domain-containing protein [Niabella pedocola]MCD2421135.1 DUF2147 domain-containing protein [Niabella pedocola]
MRLFKISMIAFVLFISANAVAQSADADKLLGIFITEGGKGKLSIKRTGNHYFGTLIWANVPDAKDIHNPDKHRRSTKIAGTVILKDFVYTGDQTWENGTVYDPESGKTYRGKILLKEDGSLSLRGFVGIAAFGRTTVWKRAK